MKKHYNQVIIILLVLSFSAMTGCVETPAAPPALVDEDALKSYGWSQTGTEEHRTREQKISDSTSISINSTVVKYRNDRLEKDIQEQVSDFKSEYKIPVNIEVPPITSEIHTSRVTFPAGVKLPNDIITRIMESKADELSSENNIENFRTTGTRQVTLQDGLTVPVYIYSGTRGSESDGLNVIGIVAAYESQGSNTVITGIIPNGSMSVDFGPVNGTLFTIDGERELEEVLRLISTIQ